MVNLKRHLLSVVQAPFLHCRIYTDTALVRTKQLISELIATYRDINENFYLGN